MAKTYFGVDTEPNTRLDIPFNLTLEVQDNTEAWRIIGNNSDHVIVAIEKCMAIIRNNSNQKPAIKVIFQSGKIYIISYFTGFFSRNVAYQAIRNECFKVERQKYPQFTSKIIKLSQKNYFRRLKLEDYRLIEQSGENLESVLIRTFNIGSYNFIETLMDINRKLRGGYEFKASTLEAIYRDVFPFDEDLEQFKINFSLVADMGRLKKTEIGRVPLVFYLSQQSKLY